jgi:trimethylamine:corrinoid methyltransferase-like protein
MRQTYWPSDLFNQKSWDAWQAEGSQDVYTKAHARVQQILAEGYPPHPLLSPSTIAALDALIQDAGAHPERFRIDRYDDLHGATT